MIIFLNKTWHTWHTHSFTFIVFGHEGGMDPILDCWRDAPQVDTRARDYFTTITKRDVLCQVILVNFWTPFSLVTVALILHILRMVGGQGSNRGKLGRSSSSACICLSARWVRGGMSCFRQNMVCASGHWTWNKRVACLPVIYNLQVIHKMWIYDFAHLAKKKNAPRFSSFLFGVDCLSSLCFWVFPGRVTRFVGLQFPWIFLCLAKPYRRIWSPESMNRKPIAWKIWEIWFCKSQSFRFMDGWQQLINFIDF